MEEMGFFFLNLQWIILFGDFACWLAVPVVTANFEISWNSNKSSTKWTFISLCGKFENFVNLKISEIKSSTKMDFY